MRTIMAFLVVFSMIFGCKQNKEPEKPSAVDVEQEAPIENKVPPSIKTLAKFGIGSYSDSLDINQLFQFKEIDKNGAVSIVNMKRAADLYAQMTKNKEMDSWPIFEIKGSDEVILAVGGKGFGGAIWAKVLVDKLSLKIKKIEFKHKAESEGYGASLTQNNFENKFVGTKVNFDGNSFVLKKNIEKRQDDGVAIDGISGATMTSAGAVDMLNYGLGKYKEYLKKE